jgi:hypothetical protein
MKYYMGHFGQVDPLLSSQPTAPQDKIIPISYSENSSLFTTTSTLAEKSITSTLDKASQLAKSEEIQAFIRENGLEPYLKDVNKEGIKNILAVMGVIWLGKIIKSPVGLAGLGAITLYALYTNKDKLIDKVSFQSAA